MSLGGTADGVAGSPGDAVTGVLAEMRATGVDASLDAGRLPGGPRWRAVHRPGLARRMRTSSRGVEALAELAPLHDPIAVAVFHRARARRALPHVPHVAAFDTAFHATLPPEARRSLPGPCDLGRSWQSAGTGSTGCRRRMVDPPSRGAAPTGPSGPLRLLVALTLEAGASVTAVDGGRSVDTSMGLTPLEGLMMATRAGIDRPLALGPSRSGVARGSRWTRSRPTWSAAPGSWAVSGRSGDLREVQAAGGCRGRGCPAWRSTCSSDGPRGPGIAAAATALPRRSMRWSSPAASASGRAPMRALAAEGLGFLGVGARRGGQRGGDRRRRRGDRRAAARRCGRSWSRRARTSRSRARYARRSPGRRQAAAAIASCARPAQSTTRGAARCAPPSPGRAGSGRCGRECR